MLSLIELGVFFTKLMYYVRQWVEVAGVPCPEYAWEPEYAEDEQESAFTPNESEEF